MAQHTPAPATKRQRTHEQSDRPGDAMRADCFVSVHSDAASSVVPVVLTSTDAYLCSAVRKAFANAFLAPFEVSRLPLSATDFNVSCGEDVFLLV